MASVEEIGEGRMSKQITSNLEFWECPICKRHIVYYEGYCPFDGTKDTRERKLALYPIVMSAEQIKAIIPIWESDNGKHK